MCDPLTITAVALMAAGTGANAIAQKNARTAAQDTMNQNTFAQANEFNRREGMVEGSDARTMDLTKKQYSDSSMLEDGTFAYMLSQAKEHSDANALADKGLITTQQQLNNSAVQTKTLEAARQSGFLQQVTQNIADGINKALPGSQQAATAQNFADRIKLLDANLTASGNTGSLTADDLVKQAYAARDQTAKANVMQNATAGSYVDATEDSANAADQALTQAGQRADVIKGRADLSKTMETGELATNSARDELAQQHATFAKGLNDWLQAQKTSAYGDWAKNQGQSDANFYERSLASEKDFASGMIGSSQNLENTNTALANYKIGNTQADTTLGDLLKVAGQGVSMYAGSTAAPKTPTFSAMLKPNNSAVVAPSIMRAGNPTAPSYAYG